MLFPLLKCDFFILCRWEEEQDMKDVRAILHGIKNGFNRGRGADENEVNGDLSIIPALIWSLDVNLIWRNINAGG